ncbi:MAG TPA: carboxypeptidase-like regulatory domain-containing protein [Candidatus Acidoferrales bacterium]|nr:carboxypeptidase-like regulatory domain-containing protein [Candidatus Acidoferrales bacterium]
MSDAAQSQGSAQESSLKQPPGQISGHVYRSDTGAPVAKVSVSLYPQDEATSKSAGRARVTRTGADGGFIFSDVPAGLYAISAWRTGFARSRIMWEPQRNSFSLRAGQQMDNLKLLLSPAGVISGTLFDEDLDPVASVTVEVIRVQYLPGGRRLIYLTASAQSNDQGNFRIPDLPPGRYYVRAGGFIQQPRFQIALKEAPGAATKYRSTYFPGTPLIDEAQPVEVRPEGETANIRIQLSPEKAYAIYGTIVGAAQSAKLKPTEVNVAKRDVVYQMWNAVGVSLIENGSFAARWLSPGEYTLTAAAIVPDDDGKAAREVDQGFASVRIVDSDVHAEIQIGRAGEMRGTVDAPPGFSFSGKEVILESSDMRYFPGDLDAAGRFDLRNVPPGEYTISILDKKSRIQRSYIKQALCSGRDFTSQPLELTLDSALDCRLTIGDDTGSVRGSISDSDTPAAGVAVVLIPQSRALRRLPRYTLTTKSDSAGRYSIAGVIPGDYFLFAAPQDDTSDYFAIDFADQHLQDAVRITVAARAMLIAGTKLSKAR